MNLKIDPSQIFPFELDPFQKQAVQALCDGKSVLICAPTGSGKTAIAEYAVHLSLSENKKIFYTTPLKALSNQKYFDFCNAFGEERVGLLTGDIQLNRNADILVLTTEIFRNMLYKSEQEKDLFERIGFLVLDECHYMKDPDRGTVWEESIIYCPPQAQIIALSATVGNPSQLCEWMGATHGPFELIQSDKRPVPLRFFFFGRDDMRPLMTPEGKLNPAIFKKGKEIKQKGKNGKDGLPTISETLRELKGRKMLPVIYFLFSRRGCEDSLKRIASSDCWFLDKDEEMALEAELRLACEQLPWLKDHPHFQPLRRGLAAHHAGLLPALKSLVERLFQRNLIKVVFATETLAAGINMPARSVVISQISKRADSGHRLLTGSEFLQMSGRAGRRGMDPIGYVVVLETAYEGAFEVATLASAKAEDLNSSFMPSYVMVLNLAARFSWSQCRELVLKSFARFEKQSEIKSLRNIAKQLSHNLDTYKADEAKRKHKAFKRLGKIKDDLAMIEEIPWPDFERTAAVLQDFGYLDAGFKPTEKGLWAADLRTDNIVLLAEVIQRQLLDSLSPFELCGLACALTTNDVRWDNQAESKGWAITDKLENCVRSIYEVIRDITKTQSLHELPVRLPFLPQLVELGFDWASSYNWPDLVQKYRAEEGDLVKTLKQASDLLKQIMMCPGASFELANCTSKAFELIYRSPIKDEMNWD